MRTLLLTIVGPDGSVDLAMSGDLPLAELMPTLLDTSIVTAAPGTERQWTLVVLGGEPLATQRTLSESGVVDGQVLQLRPRADNIEAPQRVMTRVEPISIGSPLARGLDALPPPPRLSERVGRRGRYLDRLDEAIQAGVLRRCVTIAVVSPKGGVGKSTLSVLLGSLLSRLRGDRVVAVDVDCDYGSLGRWLAPDHSTSVYELGLEMDQPGLVESELERQLAAGPDGLWVCPAPSDPTLMAALDRDRYARLIARLQDRFGVLILDCGTGLGQPGTQAAILASDQLVLVTDGEPATVDQVAAAAGLLRHAGPPMTVVANRTRLTGGDAARIDTLFPYAAALLPVSSQREATRLLCAGRFSWEDAPRHWQRELRELAAVLVSGWPELRLSEPVPAPPA